MPRTRARRHYTRNRKSAYMRLAETPNLIQSHPLDSTRLARWAGSRRRLDRDGDLGRPEHAVVDLVAFAQLGHDGPLGMCGVGLLDQRLVLIRVERLA